MNKNTITLLTLFLILLIIFCGVIVYYESRLAGKDSEISSLNSQIANQTIEIQNFTSQLENLTGQVENLTNQVEDLSAAPTAIIESVALDPKFYPEVCVSVSIPINVVVKNTGTSAMYNATLTVENLASNAVPKATYSASIVIPILRPNQAFETNPDNHITFWFSATIDKMAEARSLDYEVTLSLSGAVLDQKTSQ